MLSFTIARYTRGLADTVKMYLAAPDATIQSLLVPTQHDLDQIWGWNHKLPPTYNQCMHEIIAERARQHPDKEAICSWDGSLTYGEIERYSTALAYRLRDELGVQLHDFVPLCFEKSRWTIVAVMAVMKAGACMVMMDPSLPLARLQNMGQQVGAKVMVSSLSQQDLARSILPNGKQIVVEPSIFENSPDEKEPLAPVPPDALMYIIFTSGSTGTPKGVKISHCTYTSSAYPRAKAVGYADDWRVLDFASYAFDVSIDSMMLTLANSGCLCIPSDEDRLNDINGVMRRMRVNYCGITPSVARILDLDVISSLKGLGLGGEACSARDVNYWGQKARIIIGYGPCECTIGCTVNSSAATGRDYISIGPGNGAVIWIVNPNDHETLMPLGAVGELLVEGPIVGQGYLNDPDKTAAAFINDPRWLTAGHGRYPGRSGRLYKTGDLGRYDPDGSGGIVFVGRKDTQVKLRGQRVELGEIESQLRIRLPSDANIIAEIIVPQGSSQGQATLVAFVAPGSQAPKPQDTEIELTQLPEHLVAALSKADAEISKVLPRYMVPTAYIPVNYIPSLISGKTDRRRLKIFGTKVDIRQLTAEQVAAPREAAATDRPLTEMEQRLREAWAFTLRLDAENIRLNDNFFALGGDSLAAMRLSSVCRERGLDLSVIKTFGNPTLSTMAAVVVSLSNSQAEECKPFSLINQPVEDLIKEAAKACGCKATLIQDIYPCTATQEAHITLSLKSPEPYVAQRVSCIPSHFSVEAWKKAWDLVITDTPILRSRIVQLSAHPTLLQVVINGQIPWKHSTADLEDFLVEDRNDRINLGQALARWAIVEPAGTETRYMVWTLHHAVYDGWAEPLVLDKVRNVLRQIVDGAEEIQVPTAPSTMADFAKFLHDTDQTAMKEFWRQELEGAIGPQFPRVPSRDFIPNPDVIVERKISLSTSAAKFPFTLATLIRGAWALVSSRYSGNDDVVFGETLTGRDIALPGVEGIIGPLIATVPIRVRVDRQTAVGDYLQKIQQSVLARTPYQHMGMQNIRKVSRDAQYAVEAPSGIVIQPEPAEELAKELGFEVGDVVREAIHFNPYSFMLACGIVKDGLRVCASFDSRLVSVAQVERILGQLETACLELTKDLSRKVNQVPYLPPSELNQIWNWNREPPMFFDSRSGQLKVNSSAVQPGQAFHAQATIPWVCDLHNPTMLAPIGCPGELWLEGWFLTGDTVVYSPAWLVAGSPEVPGRNGKTQPTGAIVKLQEDGNLVFIGYKDSDSTQGQAVDVTELEVHIPTQLPSIPTAAVSTGRQVLLFVEDQQGEKTVEVLSGPQTIAETTIVGTVSVTLASLLKRFDKFVQNSLAPHLLPSAYVVVDKLPVSNGRVDRTLLQQVACKISNNTVQALRAGFQTAWETITPVQTTTTAAEDILRRAWAHILRLKAEKIDTSDNFFRLGGDSVLAMKLVSHLRSEGHGLTVADIFRNMRLADAAKVLKVNQFNQELPQGKVYQPFALLDVDAKAFVAEIRPKLADNEWTVKDILPVTDSQALDIRATVNKPRTSVQYTYLLSGPSGFNRAQLIFACNQLVRANDILRTVFIEHESTFLQVVLESLEVPVMEHTASDDLEQSVRELCNAHAESEGAFRLGAPFLHFFIVEGKDGREGFVITLSHAQYDGVSLPILLRDLEAMYTGSLTAGSVPFSSYLAHTRDEVVLSKAVSYWSKLLKGSSLSILEGQSVPAGKALFRTKTIDGATQLPQHITTASLLSAAWGLVLARRLKTMDISFGGITGGRTIDSMPDAEKVQGPCYQFTPIRIPFQSQWTASDLLEFVQRQSAESMAYDFVGWDVISKKCTDWAASGHTFFNSIVHHQDWEDFDEMPFAGQSCKVGILNPHGDAAYPLKLVSFVKKGVLNVGVVGSESDEELVESLLNDLTAAISELAASPESSLFNEAPEVVQVELRPVKDSPPLIQATSRPILGSSRKTKSKYRRRLTSLENLWRNIKQKVKHH